VSRHYANLLFIAKISILLYKTEVGDFSRDVWLSAEVAVFVMTYDYITKI